MTQGENVHNLLGVEIVEATPDRVVLTLPVGPKVHQPYGILHGGVSALLAEGAASYGGALSVGPTHVVVGTEINCSHLRALSSGTLTATATRSTTRSAEASTTSTPSKSCTFSRELKPSRLSMATF